MTDNRQKRCQLGETVVANTRTDAELIRWAKGRDRYVFIGRPSKWGNPFVIGRDGNREQVVAKYARLLQKTSPLRDHIHELRGKVLGCFCHPQNCHGHVLAAMVSELPALKVCERCGARMSHSTKCFSTKCFCSWNEKQQQELFSTYQ